LNKSSAVAPDVSIVITTHNRKEKVLKTIQSVLSSSNQEIIKEIIVIDDCSTDGTFDLIRKAFSGLSNLAVFRCEKEKFVSACRNIGSEKATGTYVFFIDDDVILSPTTIKSLADFLSNNSNIACVLPMILYYDRQDLIWCSGVKHNSWTTLGKLVGRNECDRGQFKKIIHSDSVITAFMVRRIVTEVMSFDSTSFPIGWEDMDFAKQISRLGYEIVFLPWAKVWHDYAGAHFLKSNLRLYCEVRNRITFHKKWSRNAIQYFFSVVFSIAIGLSYVPMSVFFSKRFIENTKTILKALTDGLFCPTKTDSLPC
jgi:GT2 family glycosyltransferase